MLPYSRHAGDHCRGSTRKARRNPWCERAKRRAGDRDGENGNRQGTSAGSSTGSCHSSSCPSHFCTSSSSRPIIYKHVSSPEPAGVPDTTSNENSSPEPAQVWEGDQYGIEKGSSKTLASLAESRRTQIALVEAHTQEREALLVRGNEYLERDQRGDSHPKVPIHTMVVFLAVTSTAQELCGGIVSLESYAGRQKRREKW